jgi:hypothetical protein
MRNYDVIAFTDASALASRMDSLMDTFIIIVLLVSAITAVLAWLLSARLVKPLKESWTKQRRFIADASHELKTPIAVIIANSSIILDGHPDEEGVRKWTQATQEEAEKLNDLVADMLYLAANDAEKEVVKREPLSAKEKKRMRASAKDVPAPVDFYDRVRVCPLAYIRGSTLAKSYIVCDEFQNVTVSQMKTMLTRLGRNSKMVICGDSQQCDLPSKVTSGFTHAIELLRGVRRVGFVELDVEDIIRHKLIKDIILRYERPELQRLSSPEEEAKDYMNKTHFPGWNPEEDGVDFSEDYLEDEPAQEDIDAENERFAEDWRRSHAS